MDHENDEKVTLKCVDNNTDKWTLPRQTVAIFMHVHRMLCFVLHNY